MHYTKILLLIRMLMKLFCRAIVTHPLMNHTKGIFPVYLGEKKTLFWKAPTSSSLGKMLKCLQ